MSRVEKAGRITPDMPIIATIIGTAAPPICHFSDFIVKSINLSLIELIYII
jgi:hypothetical protein